MYLDFYIYILMIFILIYILYKKNILKLGYVLYYKRYLFFIR